MTPTQNKVTFGKLDSAGPGNGGSISVQLDGEEIGEIQVIHETLWSGMSRRYIVGGYDVCGSDGEVLASFPAAGSPRSALAAAKRFARGLAA